MTETTREIFDKYEVRKTKKQKNAFIEFVMDYAKSEGYECRTDAASLGGKNIVIGDTKQAQVIYTAHYDTCAALPFPNFITPKCIWLYLLYQLVIIAFMIVPMFLIGVLCGLIFGIAGASSEAASTVALVLGYGYLIFFLFMMIFGPANKHTANDNTSGVTVVLDTMRAMPKELRMKVAFILFDLEEVGLVGSSSYYSKNKSYMKDKLLLNFDCVSDGKDMLFVMKKGAQVYKDKIAEAFPDCEDIKTEIKDKGVFYPSDQAVFPAGVGVAALRRSKGGLLYMNRIHTKRDTVYCEENIEYLASGAVKLAMLM